MLKQQADMVRLQIEALLREYPELAEDEFLRADMLEGETDVKETLTQIHRLVEDAKALRDGTQERLDDLVARRQRFKARVEFGRDLIAAILTSMDVKRVELPEATLVMRNNPPEVLGDPDPYNLPDELCKTTRTIDKKKLREAMEAGRTFDGCVLSNAPPSLMVKVR